MLRRATTALLLLSTAAAALNWVAPHPEDVLVALRHPQEWVGVQGADAAVLTLAVAACWLLLGWLAFGLLVGMAGQLPGAAGACARAMATVVLPRVLRQMVTLTLGIGLVTAGGSAAAADPGPAGSESATSSTGASVDWPLQPPLLPDSPSMPSPVYGGPPGFGDPVDGAVAVRAGDSLWMLAADRLAPEASSREIAAAVTAWYQANRQTIGSDPDLILPGQRLVPPAST